MGSKFKIEYKFDQNSFVTIHSIKGNKNKFSVTSREIRMILKFR